MSWSGNTSYGDGMRRLLAVTAATVLLTSLAAPADAHRTLRVPGAAYQQSAVLDDLTTTGTVASGHTNPADYAGLTDRSLPVPAAVPGVQVDGYFPDTSHTNTNHGWDHDAQ